MVDISSVSPLIRNYPTVMPVQRKSQDQADTLDSPEKQRRVADQGTGSRNSMSPSIRTEALSSETTRGRNVDLYA